MTPQPNSSVKFSVEAALQELQSSGLHSDDVGIGAAEAWKAYLMAKKAKLDETLAAARQFRALLRQQLQKAFASQSFLEEAPAASSCCCCGHSDVGVVGMVAALQDSQRRRLGADGGVDGEHRRATRRTLVGDHPQDGREDEVWTLVGDHPQAALDME
ncbi:uncharacterized protein [Triticum aestivum]|uniref:uncharacterized protein isoform X1 n=1 Tax=Triticum aestivum TaxID=4565 RepID=UPI001D02A848|nr:uncharacterized protein LOC123079863 isoform X1 [Triticum aestivum]